MTLPKKRDYRKHAHANSYSIYEMEIPLSPLHFKLPAPNYVDVGCGYGKFLLYLGEKEPDKIINGLEMRKKVFEYVRDKIYALKKDKTFVNEYKESGNVKILEKEDEYKKHSVNYYFNKSHLYNNLDCVDCFINSSNSYVDNNLNYDEKKDTDFRNDHTIYRNDRDSSEEIGELGKRKKQSNVLENKHNIYSFDNVFAIRTNTMFFSCIS